MSDASFIVSRGRCLTPASRVRPGRPWERASPAGYAPAQIAEAACNKLRHTRSKVRQTQMPTFFEGP
ncbi:hypothetical protein GCM10009578_038530 [Streptomyces rhizosphaericus]